ncbi:MAG TPA: HlyD family efflux transporter periplasmic adaptor subunit [Firmicutes bacterium]|nr:HlyD family efflux transporter periplasmic adaptor subunit [Bacillota bacterium]
MSSGGEESASVSASVSASASASARQRTISQASGRHHQSILDDVRAKRRTPASTAVRSGVGKGIGEREGDGASRTSLLRRWWVLGQNSRQMRLALFVLVVLAALIGAPAYYLWPKDTIPVLSQYSVTTAEWRTFRKLIGAGGQIEAAERAEVMAPVAGVVARLFAAEGDYIEAGEPLLQLASSQVEEKLARAEQALEKAKLELQLAELDMELNKKRAESALAEAVMEEEALAAELALLTELAAMGGVDPQELALKRTALAKVRQKVTDLHFEQQIMARKDTLRLEAARASLKSCEEDLALAREEMEALVVRSPLSGRVTSLKARLHSPVAVQSPIAEVAAVKPLRIRAEVPAHQAAQVTPGLPASVTTGQNTYPAHVTTVAPQAVNGATGMVVPVWLEFTEETEGAILNAPVTVEIEVGRRDQVLCLPRGAYFTSGEAKYVYVIEGDRAVRREVQYGDIDGHFFEIRSGLAPGERIISSTYDGFKDYETVRLQQQQAR